RDSDRSRHIDNGCRSFRHIRQFSLPDQIHHQSKRFEAKFKKKNQIVLTESAIIMNDLIPNVKSRSEKNADFFRNGS
ncbi:hypothetical protein, partial [Victivallis lenta]|uniref:hypothetical protein n=1 Tax=Victivallis lenta TaxID=2606640 RepID=UPI0019805863